MSTKFKWNFRKMRCGDCIVVAEEDRARVMQALAQAKRQGYTFKIINKPYGFIAKLISIPIPRPPTRGFF